MRMSDWSSDVCSSDLTDLLGAALNRFAVAGAIDDGGVVLVDGDALGGAEHAEGDVLQLDAEVFGDDFALGQDGDVLPPGLAALAEARDRQSVVEGKKV